MIAGRVIISHYPLDAAGYFRLIYSALTRIIGRRGVDFSRFSRFLIVKFTRVSASRDLWTTIESVLRIIKKAYYMVNYKK